MPPTWCQASRSPSLSSAPPLSDILLWLREGREYTWEIQDAARSSSYRAVNGGRLCKIRFRGKKIKINCLHQQRSINFELVPSSIDRFFPHARGFLLRYPILTSVSSGKCSLSFCGSWRILRNQETALISERFLFGVVNRSWLECLLACPLF